MIDDLLGTKFFAPNPHQHTIVRQRLIDELRAAVQSAPVTLISAPAGSGKTTLLATFVQGKGTVPAAWLTIDEDDNDPTRFARGLTRAVQMLGSQGDAPTHQNLSFDVAEPRQNVALLVNHILETLQAPFLLVIDDLHWITERSALALLDYLLEHQPLQMRIVLAGRYEPPLALARLRARRQLAELNLTKLAFTTAEIKTFLSRMLHLENVDPYLEVIARQTEGWAAGIALFASVADELPTGSERQAFLNMLGHSHRLVFDFLAEEILNVQRPEVRTFLLHISVLPEITVDACQFLTGRDDAYALLDEIYRRNLFLTLYMDNSGQPVYRYHDLFAAFLRERLALEHPSTARALHRRAAEISRDVEARLAHLLAAQEWETAATLLTAEGERFIRQGATGVVRQWISALPETVRVQHPHLIYLLGVCAAERWELDTASQLLGQSVELLADQPEKQGAALLHLATTLSTSGRIAEAKAASDRALQCPITSYQRAHLLMAKAWQAVALNDEQAVTAALDEVLDRIESAEDEQAMRVIAPQYHVQFTFYARGIERSGRFCRLSEHFATRPVDILRAASQSQRAWLYWWSGDRENALKSVETAVAISEQLGMLPWVETNVRIIRCIHLGTSGQLPQAQAAFTEFFAWLQQPDMMRFGGQWLPLYHFIAGRLYWAAGLGAEAGQMAQALSTMKQGWPGFEHLSRWIEALLLIDRSDFTAAEPMLQEAVRLQQANQTLRLVGDARLWLAYLYHEWGQPQAALDYVASVLAETSASTLGRICYEGARVGVPLLRLAVRHDLNPELARRVLAMLIPTPVSEEGYVVPDTGEMLTPREVEVLQLIAHGATNPAIAEALTISIHTVKIHVAHLLAKLGVSSRTAAAIRARDLGLASPE